MSADPDHLRALIERAAEGEWCTLDGNLWDTRADGEPGVPLFRQDSDSLRSWGRRVSHKEREANAALIVAAKNALPELLARLERAEAERDQALDELYSINAPAAADLCDGKLDKSGALLGRIRARAARPSPPEASDG